MTYPLKDLISRAAWTFCQAFLAVFVVGDWATAKVAAVAGVAAVLSLAKTYTAQRLAKPWV